MSLKGIRIVSIPVSDQDRAKHFYTEQIGFDLVTDSSFEMHGQKMRWIEVAPKGGYTTVALTNWFPDLKPLAGLVLSTDDVDGDYAALAARGVEFRGPPSEAIGGRVAFFADPDGNRWNLTQDDGR